MYINEGKKQELSNCNITKCILMLLVVLCHSMAFWTNNWFTKNPVYSAAYIGCASEWLGTFHVYSFIMISGYIFAFQKREKFNYTSFCSFLYKKFKRLIVPYLFVSIFYVIPVYCLFFSPSIKTIIFNYFLAISPSQLWFLICLFNVFLLGWLMDMFFHNHIYYGLAFSVFLYLIGSIPFLNIFQINTTLNCVVFFWIGYMLRKEKKSVFDGKYGHVIAGVIFLVDISIYSFYYFYKGRIELLPLGSFYNVLLVFLIRIIGVLMIFVLIQSFTQYSNKTNILSLLIPQTMSVYLFHQQIVYFVVYILNGVVHPVFHVMICFVVSVSVSFLIGKLMSLNHFTRLLIGS